MPLPRASSVGPKLILLGLGLVFIPLLSGCAAVVPQSTVLPKSDAARQIQDLYVLVWWLAVFVFVGTQGGLIWILWRYRARPGHQLPEQTHGNTRLEIMWTIAPAVVLVIMAVPTIQTIFALEIPPKASPDGSPPLEIQVIGKQWWWEFTYPDSGIVTANEMVVPVGKTVVLKLTSDNVIHSFWVPQLTGKIDAIPNHENELWFTPEDPGQYFGQCAEYCGVQHAQMRMNVIAMTPSDYQAWVTRTRAPVQAGLEDAPGAEAFASQGCAGCHTIDGTTAVGKTGPNLTHVGSRTTIAAGIMPNTPENLQHWLEDPQAVKPGNHMPNLHLRPADVQALIAYLHSLK